MAQRCHSGPLSAPGLLLTKLVPGVWLLRLMALILGTAGGTWQWKCHSGDPERPTNAPDGCAVLASTVRAVRVCWQVLSFIPPLRQLRKGYRIEASRFSHGVCLQRGHLWNEQGMLATRVEGLCATVGLLLAAHGRERARGWACLREGATFSGSARAVARTPLEGRQHQRAAHRPGVRWTRGPCRSRPSPPVGLAARWGCRCVRTRPRCLRRTGRRESTGSRSCKSLGSNARRALPLQWMGLQPGREPPRVPFSWNT